MLHDWWGRACGCSGGRVWALHKQLFGGCTLNLPACCTLLLPPECAAPSPYHPPAPQLAHPLHVHAHNPCRLTARTAAAGTCRCPRWMPPLCLSPTRLGSSPRSTRCRQRPRWWVASTHAQAWAGQRRKGWRVWVQGGGSGVACSLVVLQEFCAPRCWTTLAHSFLNASLPTHIATGGKGWKKLESAR